MGAGTLNMKDDPPNITSLGLTHSALSSLGDARQGFPTVPGYGRADAELGGRKIPMRVEVGVA